MIDFPDIKPQSMSVGLSSNSKTFTSTFNKSISATKFAGEHLTLKMSFTALDYGKIFAYDEAQVMEAFIFELGGISGVAKIPLFHRPGKPARGNPVTTISDQLGGLLDTGGWTPNAIVLKRGEYFTVNDEAKMCMADAVADSSGNVVLSFTPWLRSSPVTGTEIITQDPYGLFRLTSDDQEIELEPANGTVTLEFREAFYV